MTDIFDLLTGQQLSGVSYKDLGETATGRTYVDEDSVQFWENVFKVSKALEVSKTGPHGLPLPTHSGIKVATIGDGEAGTIQPTGTEVWLIVAIDLDSCTAVLTDGTSSIPYSDSVDYISRARNPLILTNSLYIGLNNASGAPQTPSVAYHKLSL